MTSNATDDVAGIIRDYIARNILFSGNSFPFPDDASFLEEGIVNSMNVLELVAFVESRFGIEVEDSEIVPAHFDSVDRLAAFVRRKGGSA